MMRQATWQMADDAFQVEFQQVSPGMGPDSDGVSWPAQVETVGHGVYATSREAEKATGAWLKRQELVPADVRAQLARETVGGRATSNTRRAAE